MPQLRKYKVWWSNHANSIVQAYTRSGARRKAWEEAELDENPIRYSYNWTKEDFLKNAEVEEV